MFVPFRNLRLINADMTLIFRQQIQALRRRRIARLARAANMLPRTIGGNKSLGYKGLVEEEEVLICYGRSRGDAFPKL